MTECSGAASQLHFGFHPRRSIVTTFDAPDTSSDGGVLLVRALDERLGLTAGFAALVPDDRDARFVVHTRREQIRQRVYQIALGYEDCNDADRLRGDRAFKTVCDLMPVDGGALSSQPTLSRFENDVPITAIKPLLLEFERSFVAGLSKRRRLVVLDVDPTDDPTHGAQQLTFFHGYYDTHMYFPLLVFDGQTGDLASVLLRPGNVGAARGACGLMARLIRAVRQRCRHAVVLVRADSAFATPDFLEMLDTLDEELGDIRYVIGVAKNSVLIDNLAPWMRAATAMYECTGQPARLFASFHYRSGKWKHSRCVVGKAEHLADGANPRFIVTNLVERPEAVYQMYCARGQAENFIKDFKNALHGDRLSCSRFAANFFRILLHGLAYRLLHGLRTAAQQLEPSIPAMQLDTLRLRLLKVAAIVTQSARRICVRLPEVFPFQHLFAALAERLDAPSG